MVKIKLPKNHGDRVELEKSILEIENWLEEADDHEASVSHLLPEWNLRFFKPKLISEWKVGVSSCGKDK
jgi:hypothetical protein